MQKHEIKAHIEFFDRLVDRSKSFEIRKNDRGYEVGDLLYIMEWNPTTGNYTGRQVIRQITYITDFKQRGDFVVLGFGIREESVMQKLVEAGRVAQESTNLIDTSIRHLIRDLTDHLEVCHYQADMAISIARDQWRTQEDHYLKQLQALEEKKGEINTSHRLFDLVRFMRSELHESGLISDAEYAWLICDAPMAQGQGSPSPRRLETYDQVAEWDARTMPLDKLEAELNRRKETNE